MNKLSIVICTFNEASQIEKTLQSALWADEIILIDSDSTDNTVSLAKKYTSKIIIHPFTSYAKQKNYAIDQAENDWVFVLDADEQITSELAKEIKTILAAPSHVAYKIKRQNFFMNKKIRFSGWQNDWVCRLIHKKHNHYNNNRVHEQMITDGSLGKLKSTLNHFTYKNLSHYWNKSAEFSSLAALDLHQKGKQIFGYHFIIKPTYKFIKQYIFKLGILDGKVGFIISVIGAFNIFQRYLKAWRIQKRGFIK